MRKKSILKFAVIFFLGVVVAGLFNMVLEHTNTTEFCTSCHTMQIPLKEMEENPHWLGRTGVSAGCADCHVPKQFFPKILAKIMATKDLWHEMLGTIDTPEKYEKYRWEMANAVWDKMRASDSRECRNCHSYEHMDFSQQDKSARKKHGNADDKGQTCIDCHQGIAHEEPDEPDEDNDNEVAES